MIVLDTHAWIWWLSDPRQLGARGRAAIDSAEAVHVPAICCWEVATAVTRGRIVLDRSVTVWLQAAFARDKVSLAPITPEVAVTAASFPRSFTGDPGDRLIAATAMALRCPLVTKDRQLRSMHEIETIW